MAGETTKTATLTSVQADDGYKVEEREPRDDVAVLTFAAGELEAADVKLTSIKIPSNAIVIDVLSRHPDLDTNCSPALAVDIGLYAAENFVSVTSGTKTRHSRNDVLSADALIDGSTAFQAAVTTYGSLVPDATTFGPDDAEKELWEILGYDSDPHTEFLIGFKSTTAAATAGTGSVALRVIYNKKKG